VHLHQLPYISDYYFDYVASCSYGDLGRGGLRAGNVAVEMYMYAPFTAAYISSSFQIMELLVREYTSYSRGHRIWVNDSQHYPIQGARDEGSAVLDRGEIFFDDQKVSFLCVFSPPMIK